MLERKAKKKRILRNERVPKSGCHSFTLAARLAAIPGYENGWPKRHFGLAGKTCEFRFSKNWRPTLRTPCGEERLARDRKVFRGGRATARLYRLKPAPPLLRRNAETPDLEKYFRGKQLAANASNALRRGRISAGEKLCKEEAKVGRFFPPSQAPPFFGKKPGDFGAKKEEVFPLFQVPFLGVRAGV